MQVSPIKPHRIGQEIPPRIATALAFAYRWIRQAAPQLILRGKTSFSPAALRSAFRIFGLIYLHGFLIPQKIDPYEKQQEAPLGKIPRPHGGGRTGRCRTWVCRLGTRLWRRRHLVNANNNELKKNAIRNENHEIPPVCPVPGCAGRRLHQGQRHAHLLGRGPAHLGNCCNPLHPHRLARRRTHRSVGGGRPTPVDLQYQRKYLPPDPGQVLSLIGRDPGRFRRFAGDPRRGILPGLLECLHQFCLIAHDYV